MLNLFLIIFAYLAGSVCSAIIVCRGMGLPDPRSQGSGNPGATNVLRLGGKKAAALTLFGDMLKGLVPALLAVWLAVDEQILALVCLAAFLGHLYPVFFGFEGGKGVATALGVFIGLEWRIGLSLIAIWLLMALIFRLSSLAALTAMLCAPALVWVILQSEPISLAAALITVLLFWRHRSNISNLLAGTESRIGSKKDK